MAVDGDAVRRRPPQPPPRSGGSRRDASTGFAESALRVPGSNVRNSRIHPAFEAQSVLHVYIYT
uniref:Uncharacterized protein n=1 Tax=Oryza sativa subsp. japonica TaxID=39947 RepID=Q5Z9J4_ORYSJ|nr:hypothetical protein [Oryza sativa Japonica Group]